jgi:hypothetical protein
VRDLRDAVTLAGTDAGTVDQADGSGARREVRCGIAIAKTLSTVFVRLISAVRWETVAIEAKCRVCARAIRA